MSKYYAGIGSRDTPEWVLEVCANISIGLNKRGYILRSGAADGCDKAFESKIHNDQEKEIYLPWSGFNGSKSTLIVTDQKAFDIAEEYHPYWNNLKQGGKKLQARNSHQVLGESLDDPSKFVVCYTKDGKMKGGTSQAIRIANAYNIPVFNIGCYKDIEETKQAWDIFVKENNI